MAKMIEETDKESYVELDFSTGPPTWAGGIKRRSVCKGDGCGICGTGGEVMSVENRRPRLALGGGGVGARSCTERLETEVALALRRRDECFLIKTLKSIVDDLDSDGKMMVLRTTALLSGTPSLGRRRWSVCGASPSTGLAGTLDCVL